MRLEAEDNVNIFSALLMTKCEADLSGSQWKSLCAAFLQKMLRCYFPAFALKQQAAYTLWLVAFPSVFKGRQS